MEYGRLLTRLSNLFFLIGGGNHPAMPYCEYKQLKIQLISVFFKYTYELFQLARLQ